MKSNNWKCRWFGHKWKPSYHRAVWGGVELKFIAVHCTRCSKGYDEIIDTGKKTDSLYYSTYSERYFDADKHLLKHNQGKGRDVVIIRYKQKDEEKEIHCYNLL